MSASISWCFFSRLVTEARSLPWSSVLSICSTCQHSTTHLYTLTCQHSTTHLYTRQHSTTHLYTHLSTQHNTPVHTNLSIQHNTPGHTRMSTQHSTHVHTDKPSCHSRSLQIKQQGSRLIHFQPWCNSIPISLDFFLLLFRTPPLPPPLPPPIWQAKVTENHWTGEKSLAL